MKEKIEDFLEQHKTKESIVDIPFEEITQDLHRIIDLHTETTLYKLDAYYEEAGTEGD